MKQTNKWNYILLMTLIPLIGVNVFVVSVFAQEDAIDKTITLSNTILLLVTGISGLVVAVGTVIGQIIKNKKFDEGFEVAKNGMQVGVTGLQKVTEMLRLWGPLAKESLNNLPEEQRKQVEKAGLTIEMINAMAEAATAQVAKLREKVPDFADPDNEEMLREQDIIRKNKRFSRDPV